MSFYNRRHHGRPLPPLAWNRPGYHTSSHQTKDDVDPNYLVYLRKHAAQFDSQISALSNRQRVTPSPMVRHSYTMDPESHLYNQMNPQYHQTKRNLARERLRWRFYAIKNGINGDDIYSSWHQAHPFCWDPVTKYFYRGSFCKGFDDYDSAWNFLLGL